MKAIMVMFDSLNRHMLPPYGCDWVHAPNFARLAQRTVTFDQSYICSMPCMPARRDLHTGRPNFLHRSWGPLEPFDDSVPRMLREAGVSSHLISDHYHYWETGGATYHAQYATWQFHRGQEGDPWMGQVGECTIPPCVGERGGVPWNQDWINRGFMTDEAQQPQAKTMAAGLDFIRRNAAEDNWFLQIETFDPHEPFFTQRHYKDLYRKHYENYRGDHFDWPPYCGVTERPEEVEHCRHEYAALVSMCDRYMGDVLDAMDRHDLWDDTMLIVWTDHGFMLGEHDMWAKVWLPFYEEIAHTPFFIWDPRPGQGDRSIAGQRRSALVQPAIDLGPTLLDLFGLEPTPDMLGRNLRDTIARDACVREAAIFGIHGGHVNITDGRYVYMRGPTRDENKPLHNYTLMPTHMRQMFQPEELRDLELADPFTFTKGCRTMKIATAGWAANRSGSARERYPTRLYDMQKDQRQDKPIDDAEVEQRLLEQMVTLMRQCDAPAEQYERLGVTER